MPTALEELTRRYGRDLFARLDGDRPLVFSPRWLDDRMMEWSMDDEKVKVQLFRFIDVLPAIIGSPSRINRHLKEYLGLAADRLPAPMRWGLKALPREGLVARAVSQAAEFNATRLARRFIAGSNVAEALKAIARLRRQKMAFTIDLLGEAVLTESEAEHYQHQYFDLAEGLCGTVNRWPNVEQIDFDHLGPMPKVNISVKLSSLFSQFDPIDPDGTAAAVKARLRPILQRIKAGGAFVNIDMEQYSYKDVTLRIFEEIFTEPEFRGWPHVGIAIQAYLKSCGDDLRRLRRWVQARGTPIWVRLVKGAYWDYETAIAAQNDWEPPVFLQKWQSDANYEEQTRFLLANFEWLRPAFGSHNIRSISHALALAEEQGLPRRCIEFQLLYGMADPIKEALVKMGQRVRVYAPYGQLLPGMAYLIRRLLENTANQSFLRASFIDRVSEDDLLMNPTAHASANGHAGHGPAAPMAAKTSFRNEPPADFSQEANRQKMQEALKQVTAKLGGDLPLLLGGQRVMTSKTLDSVNPSRTKQKIGRSALASPEQAREAVRIASQAFASWREVPVEERAGCLRRAAELMRQRRFEISALMCLESGKNWREADADYAEAVDFCEYYATEMMRLADPRTRNLPGEDNAYFYDAKGPCVVIAPWNFPFAIPCGMVAAGLVAGNPVILKPAEQTPAIALLLVEIFHQAGVPKNVLTFLPGIGEEVGPVLVNHPEVAVIVFTGSRQVGLLINEQASKVPPGQDHVKKVITEMGGKNAIIVDDDADLDEAVAGVAASAFGFQGQKCSACSRAIVVESLYETFLKRLLELTRSLKIGPADDPSAAVGPVIDEEARQRIHAYIEKGKAEAKLALGVDVGPIASDGYYVGPHIFVDVDPKAIIAQEEIFGPVLAVLKVKSFDEALQVATGTPYALTGGLYSRSPANLARARREFRVGNLYINRKITGAIVDRQPFGGFKLSGIGSKAGGPDYLLQFLNPRTVTENTMRHGFAPEHGQAA